MVSLYEGGAYLVNGTTLIKDDAEAIQAVKAATGKDVTKESAAKETIAYSILMDHNTSGNDKKLKIKFDDGFVETYTLLGSLEADPLNGIISNESPIGRAIINCKKGDRVLVKAETGDEFYVEVLEIEQ